VIISTKQCEWIPGVISECDEEFYQEGDLIVNCSEIGVDYKDLPDSIDVKSHWTGKVVKFTGPAELAIKDTDTTCQFTQVIGMSYWSDDKAAPYVNLIIRRK
jgi:hypothetical protein